MSSQSQSTKQHRSGEYNAWRHALSRCRNPNTHQFKDYGGRGIKVCERWLVFANFLADMGPKPTPKHTIDRINNDGNYEPGNCRWATRKENNNNTRRSRRIEFNGERLTLQAWAERVGITAGTMHTRLKTWPLDKALTVGPQEQNQYRAKLTIEQIREIKAMKGKVNYRATAKKYGVRDITISDIIKGVTWKHVV